MAAPLDDTEEESDEKLLAWLMGVGESGGDGADDCEAEESEGESARSPLTASATNSREPMRASCGPHSPGCHGIECGVWGSGFSKMEDAQD